MSATAADRAFCVAVLPRVSRTFALSIESLPESLREPVRVAYLLCRTVDTIEDEAGLPRERRERLFDAFDAAMRDDGATTEALEAACDGLTADGADGALCTNAGAVFRTFRGLATRAREAVRGPVLTMSRGMREYAARADAEGGLRLRDLDDLERYCYFVAGTVGELLSALFEGEVRHLDAATRAYLRARAVSFGLGLQLVNIVKDVAADAERGACFLPLDRAAVHDVPLARVLDPGRRRGALAVVREVCDRAREHLDRAREYTLAWPLPDGAGVRLFCAVPLALALATLDEVETGADTLVRGRTPKVSRLTVALALALAKGAAHDDRNLARFLAYFAGRA